jgi:hypothetical protein
VDWAFREGDPSVRNAVEVSFVENSGWWEPEAESFVKFWPAALRIERDRQANWRT